jgi:hypothetical protein
MMKRNIVVLSKDIESLGETEQWGIIGYIKIILTGCLDSFIFEELKFT